MMNKLDSLGVVAALIFAMGTAACAEAPVSELGRSKSAASDADEEDAPKPKKKSAKQTGDALDESEESDSTVTTQSTKEPKEEEKKELALDLVFGAAAGLTFGNIQIRRVCSNIGVDFTRATVAEGTSLSLVEVYSKKVLLTVEGAELAKIKDSLLNGDGNVHIPLGDAPVPEQAAEYAIIMGGDDRFGSVAACGVDIVPKTDKDRGIKGGAGHFPTGRTIINAISIGGDGCGIVGFIQAYYDAAKGEVYARASSPILIASDDESSAGFPEGSHFKGCEEHASPLVLDLGGQGVSLARPRADLFDIDGNGARDAISWVRSNDTPFLVRDANGNGRVDGATELFGDHTDTTSANGFEALSRFDDGDGVIDRRDRVWSTLRLWFDRNHDGRTDAGELETLESRGITSVSTRYVSTAEKLTSGEIRQRGAAMTSDGRSVPVLDVWFDRQF